MTGQAFVVSLYAAGERRASDCVPDFLPTRSAAIEAGEAALRDAAASPDSSWGWPVRFTVRKVSIAL